MSKVIVATGVESLDKALSQKFAEIGEDVQVIYYKDILLKLEYNTIVLSPRLSTGTIQFDKLLFEIRRQDKRIILLLQSQDSPEIRQALALGIYDIIFDPIDPEKVINVYQTPMSFADISYLLNRVNPEEHFFNTPAESREESEKPGKVVIKEVVKIARQQTITFWSANGGEGKTTLAAVLANTLSKKTSADIALIDFKEITPHIHYNYNLPLSSKRFIKKDIDSGELTPSRIRRYMEQVTKNLWVMTGVSLDDFGGFETEHFNHIIQTLQTEFPYIIIDTNPGIIHAGTVSAIANADTIFFCMLSHKQSLNDSMSIINFTKEHWSLDLAKIRVVINRYKLGADIDPEEISIKLSPARVQGVVYENGIGKAGKTLIKDIEV